MKTNLYIVGFMGTGKSAIGRKVARKFDLQFLDSDVEIEKKTTMTIKDIFRVHGEEVFRNMEREFVETGHPAQGCAVACGGGLVMQPGLLERLKAKGVLVCLFASTDSILERTSRNQNRPLLNVDKPEQEIRDLLEKRNAIYMRAGTGVTTENRSISEVAAHVCRIYRKEAAAFESRKSG